MRSTVKIGDLMPYIENMRRIQCMQINENLFVHVCITNSI